MHEGPTRRWSRTAACLSARCVAAIRTRRSRSTLRFRRQSLSFAFGESRTMSYSFRLCPECLANYRVLRFSPSSTRSLCLMPLSCIVWSDEHPDGRPPRPSSHRECCESIMRLSNARKALWLIGTIPQELQLVWDDARMLIPDWPGFQRQTLGPEDRASLDACAQEFSDLVGAVTRDFPEIRASDRGGGVAEFTANRDRRSEVKRPWWRFWTLL